MSGFKMFRHDRDFSIESCTYRDHDVCPGGGSIIYVSDNLSCSEIESLRKIPDSNAVAIHTNVGIINFTCFYRSLSLSEKQNSALRRSSEVLAKSNDETVIVGDLNLPNVSWKSGFFNAPGKTANKVLLNQIDIQSNLFRIMGLCGI